MSPKIALIDIETAPILGYVWTMFEANVIHVVQPTYMLCFAVKWLGQKKTKTYALCDYPGYAKDKENDKALVTDLWRILDQADIVCAHNGDSFDIKKTNSRFAVHGLLPPSDYKTIDTLKFARRSFKFDSNKLDNIGRYLQVGRKMPHTGKDLWLGCMAGNPKSWKTMRRYNAQDVNLLEQVYIKLRPWAQSHPSLTVYDGRRGCPRCLSPRMQRRGVRVQKTRKYERFQCQDCGSWDTGAIIK